MTESPRRIGTYSPAGVLAAPGVAALLDLTRPVALLTVAVVHFIPDADDPVALLARYRAHLAPGKLRLTRPPGFER